MIMTLQEVKDTCGMNWEAFCILKGFSTWSVNEGGGHIEVNLTVQEAHDLGIVKLPDWKIEKESKTKTLGEILREHVNEGL